MNIYIDAKTGLLVTDLTVSVGKQIRNLRKKRHLKQYELAEQANISQAYISQIELGVRSVNLDTLGNICDILDVEIKFIKKRKH